MEEVMVVVVVVEVVQQQHKTFHLDSTLRGLPRGRSTDLHLGGSPFVPDEEEVALAVHHDLLLEATACGPGEGPADKDTRRQGDKEASGRFKKEIVVDGQSHLLLIRDEGGPPEVQDENSFQTVYHYYSRLANYRNTSDLPLVLVGTQDAITSANPRVIDDSRARKLSNDLKRCTYYETCSTYGLNVERVFQDGGGGQQQLHPLPYTDHKKTPTGPEPHKGMLPATVQPFRMFWTARLCGSRIALASVCAVLRGPSDPPTMPASMCSPLCDTSYPLPPRKMGAILAPSASEEVAGVDPGASLSVTTSTFKHHRSFPGADDLQDLRVRAPRDPDTAAQTGVAEMKPLAGRTRRGEPGNRLGGGVPGQTQVGVPDRPVAYRGQTRWRRIPGTDSAVAAVTGADSAAAYRGQTRRRRTGNRLGGGRTEETDSGGVPGQTSAGLPGQDSVASQASEAIEEELRGLHSQQTASVPTREFQAAVGRRQSQGDGEEKEKMEAEVLRGIRYRVVVVGVEVRVRVVVEVEFYHATERTLIKDKRQRS
ncbi:hypothetical protein CRUP_003126 [Coryphaenoides rupestris]|nr:hypothetical protein CRUP_003126 [Coryphaenoides rupestris]